MSSELLTRVNDWHYRAKEEDDFFVKFIFDYLAFVALICYQNYDNKSDRILIQELKRNSDIKNRFNVKVDKEKLNEIIAILNSRPITNTTNRGDKWWDCDSNNCSNQISPTNGVIHSNNDFPNILEFIYRVRNNLFHGKKGINFDRDSLIVEYGFYLIDPLVEVLINLKGS